MISSLMHSSACFNQHKFFCGSCGVSIASSQVNLISATGAQHENWGESNMAAESSSRTDTSNDMDPDNQKLPWTMNKIYQEEANKLIQEIISALRSCS
ncbi:hypothetical protein CASFOL_017535 [Castilleja foliolosa]|uniref:Uncharacterized protein n=1 Tax=Castilleja foliolosa TaxID=1961234 RepID=A0ABD3DBA6_9LAMI